MTNENIFVLYAFCMGVFITFVYDLLRIFRRVIFHSTFWVSVEDLLFWCFCAIEVFLLMYRVSNGTLRWFAVLGAMAGMIIYLKTVSSFLVKYVSMILRRLLKVIGRLLHIIFKPVTIAGRAAGRVAGKTAGQGKRFLTFLKKRLTTFRKMLKMMLCKQ